MASKVIIALFVFLVVVYVHFLVLYAPRANTTELNEFRSQTHDSLDHILSLVAAYNNGSTQLLQQISKEVSDEQSLAKILEGINSLKLSLEQVQKQQSELAKSPPAPELVPSSDTEAPRVLTQDEFPMRYDYFKEIQALLLGKSAVVDAAFRDNVHRYVNNNFLSFWAICGPTGTWEPSTFHILKTYLKPTDIYLDFGAWIGPTVLFASQYCKQIVALEPNPAAYKEVFTNVAINPEVASKTRVLPYCISSSSGKFNMSGRPGSSMSRVGNTASKYELQAGTKGIVSWTVDCYTIEDLMTLLNVPRFDFIKIDTEGGEAFIVPAMKNYLLANKPTLYLSLHDVSPADMVPIREILAKYKYCYDKNFRKVDAANLSGALAAFLITDSETPPPVL